MTAESPLYLAIDQGGHSTRVIVVDGEGRTQAAHARTLRTAAAGERVEQDPLELIASVDEGIRAVAREIDPRRLAGAGLAVQRASVVCWDRESGEPLSPVLSWMDRRGADLVEASGLDPGVVRARTGLHLSPHYGASKLAWCLRELPAVRHARHGGRLGLGPVSAFLAWQLGGRYRVDATTAQRTLLWDRDTQDWSPTLCEAFGIPLDCLPPAVACDAGFGEVDVGGSRVPLTVCAGDQGLVVSAYGPADPSTVSVNAGTGAFVLMPLAQDVEPADRGLLQTLAWSGHGGAVRVEEGTVNGAAAALDAVYADEWPVVPGPDSFFLNGVGGLGAPWWIADYPSCFVGEVPDADSRERRVVESIVFLLMANIERLHERPERVLLTGGLAHRPDLCQWLADALALPVDVPRDREATLRGLVARLVPGLAARDPEPERIAPAAGAREHWRERQARWESLLLE